MTNSYSTKRLFQLSAALDAEGRSDQARRLHACRANRYPDDPLGYFCQLYSICPGCNWMRTKKLLSTDLPKTKSIRISHEGQVVEYQTMVWELLNQIGELKGEVLRADYESGTLTKKKKELREGIGEIRSNLRALNSVIETAATREILAEARAATMSKGLPPGKEICLILSRADQALADALTRYKDYSLQAITLTRRTFRDHHQDPTLYRELALNTKKVCFGEEFHKGHLAGPGTGAIVGLHLQDNVNLHALYFGPTTVKTDLAESWSSITRDGSNQVDCQRLHGPDDIERWLSYINITPKNTTPESLVRNWLATRGLRLLERFGIFREPCPPSMPAGVGGSSLTGNNNISVPQLIQKEST